MCNGNVSSSNIVCDFYRFGFFVVFFQLHICIFLLLDSLTGNMGIERSMTCNDLLRGNIIFVLKGTALILQIKVYLQVLRTTTVDCHMVCRKSCTNSFVAPKKAE